MASPTRAISIVAVSTFLNVAACHRGQMSASTSSASTQPGFEQSGGEALAGLIERVTYHNAEHGFCVLRAKARGHRDVVTVAGHAAIIAAGEWITASGE